MRQLPLGVSLRERATFESFLAGANQRAWAELQSLAAAPRRSVHWLCGPGGSGKSHLLQAACALASREQTAAYLPLAVLAPLGADVLAGYEGARFLCVDDLDTIVGQPAWEQALLALHVGAEERGATLLWSAVLPPAQCPIRLPDLASRAAGSLVHVLQPLGEDGQLAALTLRAAQRGLELPPETARYLQRRLPRDMESLCGFLERMDAASLREQRRLTIPFVRGLLPGSDD